MTEFHTRALIALIGGLAFAQAPPKFEDYPVKEIFAGKPAPPQLVRRIERYYRTVIRPAVRDAKAPDFAGQFIVAHWGCGTDCVQYAFVDAKTGVIYPPPIVGKRGVEDYFSAAFLSFKANSRLIVSEGNCDFLNGGICDRDYFVWEKRRFRHLRHIPRFGPRFRGLEDAIPH